MALAFALTASTMLVLGIEVLMRGFDESSEGSEPTDSTPVCVMATLVWMAMLAPLFFSYH